MRHPPSTAAQLSFFAQPRSWEDPLFVVACCCRLLGLFTFGGWTWTFFLDISFEYFLSFLLVYIKNYTDLPRGER